LTNKSIYQIDVNFKEVNLEESKLRGMPICGDINNFFIVGAVDIGDKLFSASLV
jgi:hypothetical protein